ncbi:uncharacterized protein LOC144650420 [Oculina patagonica]
MFIGQARAGKTSLKKCLLGIPFDPEEESTVGIEVDPSKFDIDVDHVKNWQQTEKKKFDVHDFHGEVAMMIASDLNQNSLSEQENVVVEDAGEMKSSHAAPASGDSATENNMEATTQYDVPSGNMADTSELLDLDINNTTVFTNDLMEQVVQCLDHQKLIDDIKAKEYTLNMWDFAGQQLYYVSHSVFLSSRAVYILVCNLSKDLNAEAEPSVKQGATSRCLKNQNRDTNLDNLISWLISVHRLKPEENDVVCKKDGTPYYVRPPVFIVGTHVDELPAGTDADEMIECIEGSVTKPNELQQHLIRPFFKVANKGSLGDDDIDRLRDNIQEVLELEPYMGEKIPIRWFHFEKIVQALVAKSIYHVKLEKLQNIIRRYIGINEKEEMMLMLNFYHDLGEIVKHGSTVVLQTQWLIDLFKQIIVVPPFKKTIPVISDCWNELQNRGILRTELINHVFDKHVKSGLDVNDILNLMEFYGLIAKFSPNSETEVPRYFVPAQLETAPDQLCDKEPSPSDPCSLYLNFPDGFVPHGLFPQLVSRCIGWCSKRDFLKEPNLFHCGARFFLGKQPIYSLVLICRKGFIKVVLTQFKSPSGSSHNAAPKELEPGDVRVFLNETLLALSKTLPWLRNLKYEWCFACTVCQCVKHNCCTYEECLHLHPLSSPGAQIVCDKNFDDEVVEVPGLDKWFHVPKESEVEEQSKINQLSAEGKIDTSAVRKSSNRKRKSPSTAAQVSKQIETTVGDEVKEGSPSDDDLEKISQKIAERWKQLGRRLKIEEARLTAFHKENEEYSENAYQMLLHWRQRDGSAATYQVLHDALVHSLVSRRDIAEEICCN